MIFKVVVIYLTIFSVPYQDINNVVVSDNAQHRLDSSFTKANEQGYCLFGDVKNQTVYVDKVVEVEHPIRRNKYRIDFSCIPQILGETGNFNDSYDFVGGAHSHPSYSEMSDPDKKWFKLTSMFQDIHGIQTEDGISFYSVDDLE